MHINKLKSFFHEKQPLTISGTSIYGSVQVLAAFRGWLLDNVQHKFWGTMVIPVFLVWEFAKGSKVYVHLRPGCLHGTIFELLCFWKKNVVDLC